jgi:hypothetical protein
LNVINSLSTDLTPVFGVPEVQFTIEQTNGSLWIKMANTINDLDILLDLSIDSAVEQNLGDH